MSEPRTAPVDWRRVVLPPEHGGWAFLAEPIVLGLLVAFSPAGALLSLAAVAGFLARQPLKLAAGDRRRGRRYTRTIAAERAFAVLAICGALALASAAWAGDFAWWPALVAAAPFAATALALDLGARSRDAAAELAATLALSAVAFAIALAGGWPMPRALALWALLAARSIPSILYVRARLRLDRSEPAAIAMALASQVVALGVAIALARAHLAPRLAVAAFGMLAVRAGHGLSPARIRMPAKRLGVGEAVFGGLTIIAIAAGWALHI